MRSIRVWVVALILIFIIPVIGIKLRRNLKKMAYINGDRIEYIIQTGSRKEALPQIYLEELLDLSVDHSLYFKQFSKKKATEALLNSFIIKKVSVQKRPPSTIYIDYEVREPIALLGEFNGIGLDASRIVFPMEGFLSPKRLPEILLGFDTLPRYGEAVEHPNLEVALTLLQQLQGLNIEKIDLRNRRHSSYAKQEIIVVINIGEGDEKHYLRLDVRDYRRNLEDYRTLTREEISKGDLMIDFRIKQLAFIESLDGE